MHCSLDCFQLLPWQLKTPDKVENKCMFVTDICVRVVFLITQENAKAVKLHFFFWYNVND